MVLFSFKLFHKNPVTVGTEWRYIVFVFFVACILLMYPIDCRIWVFVHLKLTTNDIAHNAQYERISIENFISKHRTHFKCFNEYSIFSSLTYRLLPLATCLLPKSTEQNEKLLGTVLNVDSLIY